MFTAKGESEGKSGHFFGRNLRDLQIMINFAGITFRRDRILRMKKKQRYRISFYDDSRLEQKWSIRFSRAGGTGLALALLLCAVMAGALAVSLTPARTLLPGYLRDGERNATEEMLLRLDSLQREMDTRQRYLANLHSVFDSGRDPRDTTASLPAPRSGLESDSLLGPSEGEREFVRWMRERERLEPDRETTPGLAGQSFFPMASGGIVTSDSREEGKARIAVPRGEEIMAIADGTVVAAYRTSRGGGQTLMIQHANGLLSRYSRLGRTLVGIGERVDGGESIALPAGGGGINGDYIELEIWFRGEAVKPGNLLRD